MADDRTTEDLLGHRKSIIQYFTERHTEWGFRRAETELALIEAELIVRGVIPR